MKPNELRIGNLVTVNNPEFWPKLKGVVLEVMGISRCKSLEGYENTDYAVQLIDRNNYNQTYSQFICFIEPIKCDEGILTDLGFEVSYLSSYRLKLDHKKHTEIGFDFSKTDEKSMEGFRYYGKYIKKQFVHEVQNMYNDLIGEELILLENGAEFTFRSKKRARA